MFEKLITLISSLVVSATMLLGAASPSAPQNKSISVQPAAYAAASPAVPGGSQGATIQPGQVVGWPFRGDRLLRLGLIGATAQTTGLPPREVLTAVNQNKSLVDIAQSAGKTEADLLATFDEDAEAFFNRAITNNRLPAALAENRKAWYKAAARQMVNQPGLEPAYPGLHQLHVAIISAAVKVSGLSRSDIRSQLEACHTLEEILATNGHSGQEAVDLSIQKIDQGLAGLVESGKLSTTQSDNWHAAILNALQKMITTPGLHVAGKECSH